MTNPFDLQSIHPGVAASLSRAYLTSLQLLGDAARAEALVIAAVRSLDHTEVTSTGIRNAVVSLLVEAQLKHALLHACQAAYIPNSAAIPQAVHL